MDRIAIRKRLLNYINLGGAIYKITIYKGIGIFYGKHKDTIRPRASNSGVTITKLSPVGTNRGSSYQNPKGVSPIEIGALK